jgi:hypothetical protein
MEEMIEKKLDSIIEKVLLKLNPIVELKVKAHVEVQQEKLQNQITELVTDNNKLKSRLDAMEMESRAVNLMIHGLNEPENPPASKEAAESEATQAVLNLCTSTLGLSISETDISTAFRLPRKGKEKLRPILVKFVTPRIRRMVYGARSLLKKSQIFINEHLTMTNAVIYAKTRQLIKDNKATATWTAGGAIFLRLSEDQGSKPLRIFSLMDLDNLLPLPNSSLQLSSAVGPP